MSHLQLVPPPQVTPVRACIQGELLVAAFSWSPDAGWHISYFFDDAAPELAGPEWVASYFTCEATARAVATSTAPRHPSLALLGAEDRNAVRFIARQVMNWLEAGMAHRAQADAA